MFTQPDVNVDANDDDEKSFNGFDVDAVVNLNDPEMVIHSSSPLNASHSFFSGL